MTMLARIFAALLLTLALTACDEQPQQAASTPAEAPASQEQNTAIHAPSCDDSIPADSGFAPFADKLNAAVAARDTTFLLSIVPEDIRFTFGAENGKQAFIATWQLDSAPESSPIWAELEAMLALGGYAHTMPDGSQQVIFPCTFQELPETNWMRRENPYLDGFSYVIVTAQDAVLRDEQGETLRKLDYGETLLRVEGSQTHFSTHDRKEGTVAESAIRSPVDYRAFFVRDGEDWAMPLFIAGD